MWLLEHENFKEWLEQESGPLLVTADPGCGKSVLAKYLIDHELQQLGTVCYFFFKDQDQNTIRQALCAVIHQICTQKPQAIKHAMEMFTKEGSKLTGSTANLWAILKDVVHDSSTGSVIIVLDALDECLETEIESLIQKIETLVSKDKPNSNKLLITCRPYEEILWRFKRLLDVFPKIRIPGEDNSEKISLEVNRVVQHKIERLANDKGLTTAVTNRLAERLLGISSRTYLWVYLVFDVLEQTTFKKTPDGIDSITETLPKNVNQAYEQILNKSPDRTFVRKALSIILAATRPFTIEEMNVALNTDESGALYDLESSEDFKSRLRSWCGLFVSVHHNKVYLFHQTARAFLLTHPTNNPSSELTWHRSIDIQAAHALLVQISFAHIKFACLVYSNNDSQGRQISQILLDYCALSWGLHFRESRADVKSPMIETARDLCDSSLLDYQLWIDIYRNQTELKYCNPVSGLLLACYLGLDAVVQRMLEDGAPVDVHDSRNRSCLTWAAIHGYEVITRRLIDGGATVDWRDEDERTPLAYAAKAGHEARPLCSYSLIEMLMLMQGIPSMRLR